MAFINLLCIAFLIVSAATVSAQICRDWKEYNNNCYKFFTRSLTLKGRPWDDAEVLCQSYGGHLASITNQAEQNYIFQQIKSTNERYWIGYNDRANESNFVWTDGYNATKYANWRKGEPNNYGNEDCVEINFKDGFWNDENCAFSFSYICQRKKGSPWPTQGTVLPPVTQKPIYCGAGWDSYGGSCFKFSTASKTWLEASKDCRNSGGYLAKIDSSDKQHYFTYRMKTRSESVWIGLNDRAIEGTYVWDGDNTKANYTNWFPGEPNDYSGKEDCVHITASQYFSGFWNDNYCGQARKYVCEIPKGQSLCPVNWVPFGDVCFEFNTHPAQALTWIKARASCRLTTGADLASIISQDEQTFVWQQLKDLKSWNVWLGLNDILKEGLFEWSDRSTLTFTNWGKSEPDKGSQASIKDCGLLAVNVDNGTWATQNCSYQQPYVCRRNRGHDQCNSPLGMQTFQISDSQITASSMLNANSPPSQARLNLQSSSGSVGAWCAKRNVKGEYLQIDFGAVRKITHLAVQGRPKSKDYVTSFYIRYGSNGQNFINYGENATQSYVVLSGNSNSDGISNIILPDAINCRFIRLYPLQWSNNICIRTEMYGCDGQVMSTKCRSGWEEGPDNTCYQYNTNKYKLWADARASCTSQGGDLLSIVTNNVRIYIDNRMKALASSVTSFWIGLNDRESNRVFQWSDQSPFVVTRWDAGYPKDSNNAKACVELLPSRLAWRDIDCGQYRPYICKRKLGSVHTKKYSMTANWISATDSYWPLDGLVDGKVLGTFPGKIFGSVTQATWPLQKSALRLSTYNAYIQVGEYPNQCISDADACTTGLSVSFIVNLNSSSSTWSPMTTLVDSIGDSTLSTSRGFSIYIKQGQVKVTVSSSTIRWSVSSTIRLGVWHQVAITWLIGSGLRLYVDGIQKSSDTSGSTLTPAHISNNFMLTVGSKSNLQKGGAYFIRSLGIWQRVLDPSEVMDIFLAELGICSTGWKEFGQYCYQFNSDKKNWLSARTNCQNQGGDLVSITSPVEQAHITLEVGFFGLNSYAWIGFHDKSLESVWEWSDGSPARFTNWQAYQPDNYYWHGEDCGHVYHQTSIMGRWNDIICTTNMASICKRKKVIPSAGSTPSLATRQQTICERTSGSLNCPSSTVISVQAAKYGRSDKVTCGYQSVSNCYFNATTKVKSMCDGVAFCSINPTNQLFNKDPCIYIRKYLDVSYKCVTATPTKPVCPSGWQRNPDGTLCYGLMLDKKNWFDARASCKKKGGELASIHFGWESALVTSLLVTSWDAGDVWIGLTDHGQRGVYRWSDNSPVDFTHWWNGQPNDRNVNGSCVRATMTSSSRDWMYWVDGDCNTNNLAYVCKKFRAGFTPPPKKPTTIPGGKCPSGWATFSSGCYKVFMQKKSWTAARDACRTLSKTDLVSIHSAAENTFVSKMTNSSYNAWIGLNDRGILSGHVWTDGTPVDFTKWGPVQPDSHAGQQPCVVATSTGSWNDVGCFSTRPYICKMQRASLGATTPLPTKPQPPITAPPGTCDLGWKYWNQMCYLFSKDTLTTRLSWFNARSACRKTGGELVSVLSAAENAYIQSMSRKMFVIDGWIGLNDLGTEGSYEWSDGSPLSYVNYNWGEPNDWKGQEDCLHLYRWNGKWNDNQCGRRSPYICKKHNNTFTPPTTLPPTPGPALGKCESGWTNYDKSCYKLVDNDLQTWSNALKMCQNKPGNSSMNGNLLSVNNQYEQAFVNILLSKYKWSGFWTGLNDLHTENLFTWSNNDQVTYTNWNSGQPVRNWRLDCVDMWTGNWGVGRWRVRSCSIKLRYICEAPALPLGPTPAPTPSSACPLPFTKVSADTCFAMFYSRLTWSEAREVCSKYDADLVSIHSPYDQSYMVSKMLHFPGNVWIGMTREANSQQFKWSDLSLQEYSHWSKGQPGAPGASKMCVFASNSTNNDGRWVVADCGQKNGFMCQINKGDQQVTPVEHGTCLPGFKKFDKFCYLFKVWDRQTWSTARYRCNKQGGDLLSILNQQEKDYIVYQLKELRWKPWVWIGLNDRSFEQGYTWSDGSPVTYTAWAYKQPSDNQGTENCVDMWTGSGYWTDRSCMWKRGYICKAKLECSSPLGMSSGNITNTQINASSYMNALYKPEMARINGSSAWCAADTDKTPYIEVDLLDQMEITKIGVQGFMLYATQTFIKSFTVSYAVYKNNWMPYQVNGVTRVFSANINAKQISYPAADPPIRAQFIRIQPKAWNYKACAKFEFYGCILECQKPLGIHSRLIRDELINASSQTPMHDATQARPVIGRGWCASTADKKPYLQVTWPGFAKRISKIGTWGAASPNNAYVTTYKLAFSDDGQVFTDYIERGSTRIFRGNTDSSNQIIHALLDPIRTQYFRIYPLSGGSGGLCLRFEIYGCASGCIDPLGLETGTIEDSWITASSKMDDQHGSDMARLNGPRGWCAAATDSKHYLRVSLGGIYRIRKVSTQGSADGKGYVKAFYLRSFFKGVWTFYSEFGDKYMFTANHDSSTVISKVFRSPNRAIQVDFQIQSWSEGGSPCMRVEIFGCVPNNVKPVPTSQPSIAPSVIPTTEPRDVSYKVTFKITNVQWKDDYSDRKTQSFKILSDKIVREVSALYNKADNDMASLAFEQVQVIGFRRGSVIVDFNVTFFADIAEGANVIQRIKDTVNNGSLGNLTVDPESLVIVQIKQSGGSTAAQKQSNKGGLSAGAKAGISITVLLLVGCAFLLGFWYMRKRKTQNNDAVMKHQQFDNPIHFSSKAYDFDDAIAVPDPGSSTA